MKKFIYIIFAALLGLVSCTVAEPVTPGQVDGKVTILMSVTLPEPVVTTKGAMGVDPVIDNIYVATFGTEHYLNDYVQAVPCDEVGNPKDNYAGLHNGDPVYFKVTLNATQTKRYVHIIANGPSALNYHDPEDELMQTLTTLSPNGAYWTYFVLPNGTYDLDPVTGKNRADNYFKDLKLIRNFARVVLTSSADNFVLTGYKVFNTATHGSIAVYSEGADSGIDGNPGYFPSYHTKTMKQLISSYTPFMPNQEIDSTAPTTSSSDYDTNDKFIFERPDRQTDRPFIIMKGIYGDDTEESFYRLEFVDPEGNYLPILRNFQYTITLNAVTKKGVANPTLAINSSNTNVSALSETESLTDLSDGVSRIYVQWLDQSYMGADAGEQTFKYMYLRDASVTPHVSDRAELSIESGAGLAIVGDDAASAFTYVSDTPGADGWYTVKFNTTAGNGTSEVSTRFRVTGRTTTEPAQSLYRSITVHVLPSQTWGTATRPYPSASTSGDIVTVTINLPTGLPSSLFPLEISFEDRMENGARALTANGVDMPSVVGPSIITGNSNTSYQFVKTVGYLQYNPEQGGSNVVTCQFKRIRSGATRLYLSNKYFLDENNYIDIN